MIDGITVLKTVTDNTNAHMGYFSGAISFGIVALICIVIFICRLGSTLCSKSRGSSKSLIIALFCGFAMFTFIFVVLLLCYLNPISWKEYKVKISTSVSYKNFISKYYVVNQNGEIYTIVDVSNKNFYNH